MMNTIIRSDNTLTDNALSIVRGLVTSLRPSNGAKAETSIAKFKHFLEQISTDEPLRMQIKNALEEICLQNNPLVLFTDAGLMGSKGFVAEGIERFSYKFLPPLPPKNELRSILGEIFCKKTDYKWITTLSSELWVEMIRFLGLFDSEKQRLYWQNEILNAILVLSQRCTALSLEPEIIEKLPDMDDLQSPFLSLNKEITYYVESHKKEANYYLEGEEAHRHILVMIKQCEDSISRLHKHKDKYGVSLRITYFILRLSQQMERIKMLLLVVKSTTESSEKFEVFIRLFKEIIFAENKKYSLGKHFSDNLSFLAHKIVEHTSKTGEHYITQNKQQYVKMLLYALGGGAIVAFLCIFKAKIYYLHLPPFGQALMYSFCYSLGFMLIHILHFTLATKQPAMTASTIADAIENWEKESPSHGNRNKTLQAIVPMIVKLTRSQFIALVGNIVAVMPVAFVLTWLYQFFLENKVVDTEKAQKIIAELYPFDSFALPHAAIAGVFLMTSGLISGYYDNKVIYENIPERLARFSVFRKILPQKLFLRLVNYIADNLGALAGNFYLGIFLGSIGTIGFILGLPLDIRHVTFASGNFMLAFVSLDYQITPYEAFKALLGIFLIGLINVMVSFGLSVVVALKSRNITFNEAGKLIGYVLKSFVRNPLPFFFPPKNNI